VQAYLDFMWMTRDFKFFIINVVADFILSLSGVVAVFLLAERFAGIGVWSRDQVLFMLGYAALVDGVLEMFCSYNVLHISRRIGRGQLDHTLVQPQPLWMALLTEGFMPFSGCWGFLAGLGISAWAFGQLDLALSFGWWLGLWGPPAVFLCGGPGFFFSVGGAGLLVSGGCRGNQ
jgi:ABC-2 type transport system permease protein